MPQLVGFKFDDPPVIAARFRGTAESVQEVFGTEPFEVNTTADEPWLIANGVSASEGVWAVRRGGDRVVLMHASQVEAEFGVKTERYGLMAEKFS